MEKQEEGQEVKKKIVKARRKRKALNRLYETRSKKAKFSNWERCEVTLVPSEDHSYGNLEVPVPESMNEPSEVQSNFTRENKQYNNPFHESLFEKNEVSKSSESEISDENTAEDSPPYFYPQEF